MNKIYLKARAKINLSLEVLEKREDNYHNIKSVFQKINLYDEMVIEKTNTNQFELETNIKSLENEENIIYKAYGKLKEKYDNISGVKIRLKKKIPMQAGLGGGSTDCASFILGINQLFDLRLPKSEIERIGKSLGADVVPCLYNKAVLAEGIGDKITTIQTNFKYYIVIVKTNISGDTKEMYHQIDQMEHINPKNELNGSSKIINGLQNKNVELIANHLYNTFEEVPLYHHLIQTVKEEFLRNGAIGSLMTGSGACVYGIFRDRKTAQKAYQKLKANYDEIYISTSYNSKRREKFDR